jgi:hypothetical protein
LKLYYIKASVWERASNKIRHVGRT